MTKDIIARIRESITEPPVPIAAIIRSLGLEVEAASELPIGISGQIEKSNGSFRLSASKEEHNYRRRFTLAHELGHYVLHRNLIGEGLDDNTKYRSTQVGKYYNTHIDYYHERQANAFAASILLPEHLLTKYMAQFALAMR